MIRKRAWRRGDARLALFLIAALSLVHVSAHHADSGRLISNLAFAEHAGRLISLDLYLPSGMSPPGGWPLIVAFPGGGWRQADRRHYGRAASIFTRHGFAVAAADYTYADISGGQSWPTCLEDARQAIRWLRARSSQYGLDPTKIVVMGESAGAHLALLVANYPEGPVAVDRVRPIGSGPAVSDSVRAVVDFYGATDLAALHKMSRDEVLPYFDTFLGGPPSAFPDRYEAASPIHYVSRTTPPVLILQGLADHTVFPAQSLALDAALSQAGVPHRLLTFPGIRHGFRFEIGPHSLVPEVVGFLREVLDQPTR